MSIAKTEALLETVHCLVCDCTYPENAMPPIVEACPHCGNSDKNQTVYLSNSEQGEDYGTEVDGAEYSREASQ